MEGSSSSSLPPFLSKTYEMVDDALTDDVVSWTDSGASFVVWKPLEFSRDLLPKYFKHNNFSSFVRQLNTYGFHKVDAEQWEFANEDFIRGQKDRMKNIHRRKPIFSHSSHNQGTGQLVESERRELEEEIEKLKYEKSTLVSELQRQTEKKHEMDQRMQFVEDRLQAMEGRQKNLIAYLRQIIKPPDFVSTSADQSNHHSKKRRLPKAIFVHEDANVEQNQIEQYQDLNRERIDMPPVHALHMVPFEKMESSLNSLENLLRGASEAFGEDMIYDTTIAYPPSAVVITETHTSSGESDRYLPSPTSKMHTSSGGGGDVHSLPEAAESTSCAESPTLPPTDARADARAKMSNIDVNSAPAATDTGLTRDQAGETTAHAVQTGVNDGFWEQFLTEHPGSSAAQEVQSERRDDDDMRKETKTGDRGSLWWGKKNVDHITAKMGHLTSAEKT